MKAITETLEASTFDKLMLQRRWAMYQRMFGRKVDRAAFGKNDDPAMQLLLNHFYDEEIVGPYTFNEIELNDIVKKSLFDDVAINNFD